MSKMLSIPVQELVVELSHSVHDNPEEVGSEEVGSAMEDVSNADSFIAVSTPSGLLRPYQMLAAKLSQWPDLTAAQNSQCHMLVGIWISFSDGLWQLLQFE